MNQKKKIVQRLNEMDNKKHVVMTSDKYKEMEDELEDDTVVKIVDENGDSAGRGVEYGINPEAGEEDYEEMEKLKNMNPKADESPIDEVNQEVLDKFIEQYGEKKGKQIYYATANKQDRSPETFHTEAENVADEQVNVPKLQADVQKFMDKLNLGQFQAVMAKIDKPIEKAELIAAFAERIGVPRTKLAVVLSSLKASANAEQNVQPENTRPRMKKNDLVEHVLKNKR